MNSSALGKLKSFFLCVRKLDVGGTLIELVNIQRLSKNEEIFLNEVRAVLHQQGLHCPFTKHVKSTCANTPN